MSPRHPQLTFLRHTVHPGVDRAARLQREVVSGRANIAALSLELQSSRRELAAALESVRVAREHAERAIGLKSHFLSLVSHELRTPLTSLRLQLQTLERHRHELRPHEQHAITVMLRSTSRLWSLIESLLERARVPRIGASARCEAFDLARVVLDVITHRREIAERKGLAFDVGVDCHAPMRGDPRLARVVLFQLIDNAVKFTDHGRVRVWIEPGEATHRVVVEDSGPGIALKDRERIFEAFEHVGLLRHKHHAGVGLGLTLARDIVDGLGGRIEVTSAGGRGSRFTVELPVGARGLSAPSPRSVEDDRPSGRLPVDVRPS